MLFWTIFLHPFTSYLDFTTINYKVSHSIEICVFLVENCWIMFCNWQRLISYLNFFWRTFYCIWNAENNSCPKNSMPLDTCSNHIIWCIKKIFINFFQLFIILFIPKSNRWIKKSTQYESTFQYFVTLQYLITHPLQPLGINIGYTFHDSSIVQSQKIK